MFISYEWLKELTDTKLTPAELRERLTMVGLAIDAVDEHNGDAVLDVEVPSNRPDCLSHVGVAREVSVIDKSQLRLPASEPPKAEGRAADFTSVEIEDPDLCPRYAARLVRGVKIGPSPDWLVKRLETIGQRPINNVADITNYVLHELGQPLHAFDFEKLEGVQWLAQLVKHVVSDVGDVVDGTLTDSFETFHEPIGRWTNLHASDETSRVSRTQIRIFNLNGREIRRASFSFRRFRRRQAQLTLLDDGHFARDADM